MRISFLKFDESRKENYMVDTKKYDIYQTNRLNWIDSIKGVFILLVVFGHLTVVCGGGGYSIKSGRSFSVLDLFISYANVHTDHGHI